MTTLLIGILMVILWFLYLSNLTYYRFKIKGIKLNNPLMYIFFPYVIFFIHIKMMFQTKYNHKRRLMILYFFFVNYKSSLIFFTEMILEHAAQVEIIGYSPYLEKVDKKQKTSILKEILDWFKQPSSPETFGKLVFAN